MEKLEEDIALHLELIFSLPIQEPKIKSPPFLNRGLVDG